MLLVVPLAANRDMRLNEPGVIDRTLAPAQIHIRLEGGKGEIADTFGQSRIPSRAHSTARSTAMAAFCAGAARSVSKGSSRCGTCCRQRFTSARPPRPRWPGQARHHHPSPLPGRTRQRPAGAAHSTTRRSRPGPTWSGVRTGRCGPVRRSGQPTIGERARAASWAATAAALAQHRYNGEASRATTGLDCRNSHQTDNLQRMMPIAPLLYGFLCKGARNIS
jgi:hypothetical protein